MHKFNCLLLLIGILFFSSFSYLEETTPVKDKFVIVLDAGHGGKDPGRPTKLGYTEKAIALKLVLKIGEALEKNPSIKVIYTRKTDVFIKLRERARIANKADADLFVSIHCNAHNTQAHGTETFVVGASNSQRNLDIAKEENEVIFLEDDYSENYEGFDPNSPESIIGLTLMQEEYVDQSIMLANLIETNFAKKAKRKSRGVKQASLWVMHNTYMPSVLIETGFITNKKEGAYLNSKKGQEEISNSIVASILEYKKNIDQGSEEDIIIQESVDNTTVYADVVFKVQIAASSRNLALKSYNFKGLKELSRVKQGKLYKYYSGNTSDYDEIKAIQKTVKTKGYPKCYIVAYKNGIKVNLSTVLKK
ncbi:MAG: N-acetylmuramoyl-L-alanine amidase [Flavobacteriaceae bacterium]|nr:N-acetylmuramoyl-L-alanine amidase [Flavobacteriaceae bacterium]